MRGSTAFQRVVAALLRGMARNSKETASGRHHCAMGRQTRHLAGLFRRSAALYSVCLPASNARAPAVSACLPPSVQ